MRPGLYRSAGVVGLWVIVGLVMGSRSLPAQPPRGTPPEIAAERDALINKIARGEDYEKSVARFLVLQRELFAQRDAEKLAEQKEQEQRQREQQELRALQKTLDYLVAQHCPLRVDPSQPAPPTSDLLRSDWGKVVRKQQTVIKGRTAFDDDEPVTVYLVKGAERTYSLSSKAPTLYVGKGLQAEVGDLVLLCWVGVSTHGSGGYFPEGFRDNVIGQGFAARLAAPPLIVKKARWNPIHLTGESAFRLAIDRVQWSYPEDRAVLGYIHVLGDLGQGRFEIAAERRSYVLEVPAGVSHRELVQPGKYLWAIMSTPRFDKAIKKLVLRAEDFEEHYVQGRD